MKKKHVLIILIILVLSLSGCEDNKNNDVESTVFNNDRFPSFLVDNIETSCGEDVIVFVKLKDNPGFLTMAMNIEYDSSVMTLMDVKNGSDYEEYNFTGPKNMNSVCCATWYILELPEKIVDGKLAELHFKILDNAKKGEYQLKILRPNNGGIVDRNKEPLVINNAIGCITIK